jgi:hypothetical protein
MRFDSNVVYGLTSNPVVVPGQGGGLGGGGWIETVLKTVRGRFGNKLGYGRLEYDVEGRVIRDRAGQVANRPNEGASWTERLTIPVTFPNQNATSDGVINVDIARCAGLQGTVKFVQNLAGAMADERVIHHELQTIFPNMGSDEAKELSALLRRSKTEKGDFTEVFFRVLVLMADVWAGAVAAIPQIGGAAPTYQGIDNRLWPQGVGGGANLYAPLLQSFKSGNRAYYIPGTRGSLRLDDEIRGVLWCIAASNMGLGGAGMAQRNAYGRAAMFSDRLWMFLYGNKDQHNSTVATNGAAAAVAPEHCIKTIDWLLRATGDKAGLSNALCQLSSRIPFAPLAYSVSGIDPALRCAATLSTPVQDKLTYLVELALSYDAGAATAALNGAYATAFTVAGAGGGPGVLPASINFGLGGAGAWRTKFRAAHEALANHEEFDGLLNGLVAARQDQNHNVRTAMAELMPSELAVLAAWMHGGRVVPLVLKDAANNDLGTANWPAEGVLGAGLDPAARRTAVGSSSRVGLPAQGLMVNTVILTSNGVAEMLENIKTPSGFGNNKDNYVPPLFGTPDEVMCSLAVTACHQRAIADEILRLSGRTNGLETIIQGEELVVPGAAAAWTNDDLYHCASTFAGMSITPARSDLDTIRGARALLWPELTNYVGERESVGAPNSVGGAWALSVAFTPLQIEVITGLGSSVGGTILNVGIFNYLGRNAKYFLNRALLDSDLNRSNRIHLACAAAGLAGKGVRLEYEVHYTTDETAEQHQYTIPVGTVRSVRCDATRLMGEVLTTCNFTSFLPEQQLRVADCPDFACPGLITGTQMPRGVAHDSWVRGLDLPLEYDSGSIGVSITTGQVMDYTGKWRDSAPQAPAIANPGAGQSWHGQLVRHLLDARGAARRLLHRCAVEIDSPWAYTGVAREDQNRCVRFNLEDGTNRFVNALKEHAGTSTVIEEEKAQRALLQDANREAVAAAAAPENAVGAIAPMQLQQLGKRIDDLTALVQTLARSGAKTGGNLDRGGGVGADIPAQDIAVGGEGNQPDGAED